MKKNNTYKIILSLSIFLLCSISNYAQKSKCIKGIVYKCVGDTIRPLPYANVYWLESGTHMKTDINGMFDFVYFDQVEARLLATSVGYNNQLIKLNKEDSLVVFYLHSITEMTFTKIPLPKIRIDSKKRIKPINNIRKKGFLSNLFM